MSELDMNQINNREKKMIESLNEEVCVKGDDDNANARLSQFRIVATDSIIFQ